MHHWRLGAKPLVLIAVGVVLQCVEGVSIIDVSGQPFYDPEADAALFQALRENLDSSKVELVELDADINDPTFSGAMADRLLEMLAAKS